jgi:hypothetical protein
MSRTLADQKLAILLDHGCDDAFHVSKAISCYVDQKTKAKKRIMRSVIILTVARFFLSTLLQLTPYYFSAVLDEFLILDAEGGGKMAVNVELSRNLVFYKDRHDNFRFGF